MKYNTINITDETLNKLNDLYYPLRRKKKIKSYDDLISKLIKYFRKNKEIQIKNEQI
jgi:predicted CopG family antitoxin